MQKKKAAVRVGRTELGRAVFAARYFRDEQVVGEIRGSVIDDPDYGSDYCMDLGNGLLLEPAAPFRYLNHSCQPNCELFVWESDDDKVPADRLWLQAIRDIDPGEQLTIDYGWPADAAIPCDCRSPQCRGWIVHPEELDKIAHTLAG